jgi:hypothetical protein
MTDKAKDKNCGSCVHWINMNNSGVCYAADRLEQPPAYMAPVAGPHDCGHWLASDAHRQADALEFLAGMMAEQELQAAEESAPAKPEAIKCESCGSVIQFTSRDTMAQCVTCSALYERSKDDHERWELVIDTNA